MPEIEIKIGSRSFDVACQAGEEHFLRSAAALLDAEAQVLIAQIGRLPDVRMLLMAGLMLADKTAGLEDKIADLEARLAQGGGAVDASAEKAALAAAEESHKAEIERIKSVLADLTQQAEDVATQVEAKAS